MNFFLSCVLFFVKRVSFPAKAAVGSGNSLWVRIMVIVVIIMLFPFSRGDEEIIFC